MKNPFDSVENMLQWQVDKARQYALELQESLSKCGELYPLPKSSDGLPKEWAFGKLTSHQVSLIQANNDLQGVFGRIERTEFALSEGKLPEAIEFIIQVNQLINSVSTNWSSTASVRQYRYIAAYRNTKSLIAQSPRKPKPSQAKLREFKNNYEAENGKVQGWNKAAQRKFGLDNKTINSILKAVTN